jgi:hypothetical protein
MPLLSQILKRENISIEKWREVRRESACVFVERSRTVRISIRMGWEHMVSEGNGEIFVFRARTGPLCSSECSKIHLYGHREKVETVIGRFLLVSLMCVSTKVMDPMNHVSVGIVFASKTR